MPPQNAPTDTSPVATLAEQPTTRSLLSLLFQTLLPYWDPFRRRRIRTAARGLVSRTPWPGDEATPQDVAELALLRLLWLQPATHPAALLRQFGGTMLLARAAVEACIAAHYWLVTENAAGRLGGGNAWPLQRLLNRPRSVSGGNSRTPWASMRGSSSSRRSAASCRSAGSSGSDKATSCSIAQRLVCSAWSVSCSATPKQRRI